ncbi:MAG: hypothetical protein U9R08_05585 [Nanoarchaeota archaeon]|nr:hypothetical protein [Nanoarchaeota archaeon]
MKLTETKLFIYTLIAFFVVVLIFTSVRAYNFDSIPAGDISYFHARMSKIVDRPALENDALMGREYTFQPYHLLLHYSGMDALKISNIIPVVLGFFSLLLFILLLKKLGLDVQKRLLLALILIISPAFIYMTTVSNPHVFALFLGLLGFYLYFTKNVVSKVFAVLLFLILPLFGIIETVMLIVLLLGFYFVKKNKRILFLVVILVLIYMFNFNFGIQLIMQENAIQSSITDLGGMIGFGVFNVLLAIIGFLLTWNFKRQHYTLYLIILILFLSVKFLGTMTNVYLNFIFAYLACLAFSKLLNRRWDSDIIKYLTIFVLISGLLFSGLSYLDRVANAGPNKELVDGLLWLRNNSNTEDIVLSHYSRGFWIEYYSDRTVVADSYTINIDALNHSDVIFWSRNLETTKKYLTKYGIDYIFIDSDMKQGLVWSKEEQGLLFLFKNKETFEKVYDLGGVEIWKAKTLN